MKSTISKEEAKLFALIKSMYGGEYQQSLRPDELKNDVTGQNLEIDIYIPKYMVGFEYQGAIHFKNVDRYRNDADKSRLHDFKKYEILGQNDSDKLVIVEIFEPDLRGDIKSNVLTRIINTQEYWFKNKHFLKCKQLERVLVRMAGFEGTPLAKNSIKWFSYCANTATYKGGELSFKSSLIKLFYLRTNREFFLPNRYQLSFQNFCEVNEYRGRFKYLEKMINKLTSDACASGLSFIRFTSKRQPQ